MNASKILKDSLNEAIKVAKPAHCLAAYIPAPPTKGRVFVIGAGKASAEMARVFEEHYAGEYEGLVITRYEHSAPTTRINIMEAAHPVPDESCVRAVDALFEFLSPCTKDDLVICLISGGGSSLLSAPIEGIDFETLKGLSKQLLLSGAEIDEVNTLRKHLNRALGGGLARAVNGAKLLTLSISDVAYNKPSVIASGSTVGDPSTLEDCKEILRKYDIAPDAQILKALNDARNETPFPDDKLFDGHEYHLIATPEQSLDAAKTYLEAQGIETEILSSTLGGDTNERANEDVQQFLNSIGDTPLALISGGETTVKVKGNGRGGPNTQFMLQSAITLDSHPNIYALACDTDGIDGSEDNAGALITPDTLQKARELGINPHEFLANNDSYSFFERLGDLIITKPTYTNVNDFRIFLFLP